jgi:hypothetical protein
MIKFSMRAQSLLLISLTMAVVSAKKTKLVVLVARHGITSKPDANEIKEKGNMEDRVLTPEGLRGSYYLGKLIGKKHGRYLTDNFTPEKHHFIASLRNRCILSAESIGLGVFKPFKFKAAEGQTKEGHLPPIGPAAFQDGLDTQKPPQSFNPITVTTFGPERQILNFAESKNCPALSKRENQSRKTFFMENWNTFQPFVDELVALGLLEKYTEKENIKAKTIQNLCLNIIGESHAKVDHKHSAKTLNQCLMFINILTFDSFRDPAISRLRFSGIWSMIKPHIDKIDTKSFSEFLGIIGHEKTVATLVQMVKPHIKDCLLRTYQSRYAGGSPLRPDEECTSQVDYSSNVILNFYESNDGQMHVGIAHNGKPLLFCSTRDCTLKEFREKFESRVDPNPALLCGLVEKEPKFEFELDAISIAIMATFLALLMLVGVLFSVYRKFEKRRDTELASRVASHTMELVQP